MGDGGFPIDALHADAVDIDLHDNDVVALGVENFEGLGVGAARRAVVGVEINDDGFAGHDPVGEGDFFTEGDVGGLGGFGGGGDEGRGGEKEEGKEFGGKVHGERRGRNRRMFNMQSLTGRWGRLSWGWEIGAEPRGLAKRGWRAQSGERARGAVAEAVTRGFRA